MRYVIPHPVPRSVSEGGWGRVGTRGARSGATWWIWSLSAGPHFCALETLSDRPGVRLARLGRVPQRWLAGCILAVRPCHVMSCIHPSIRPSIHSSLLSLRPHQHPLSPSGTSHPTLSISLLLISGPLAPSCHAPGTAIPTRGDHFWAPFPSPSTCPAIHSSSRQLRLQAAVMQSLPTAQAQGQSTTAAPVLTSSCVY